MKSIEEQARALLNCCSEEQDQLQLLNYFLTAPTEVIKEAVRLIKSENETQHERDKKTLAFYDNTCSRISELLENKEISESQKDELIGLLKELISGRKLEKEKQDERSEKRRKENIGLGIGIGVVGVALVGVMVALICKSNINDNYYGKNNFKQVP